jgi:DNA-binding CsgD family transcriptional regulator
MSSDSGRAAGPVGRGVEVRRVADVLGGHGAPSDSALLVVGSRGMGRTTVLNAAADLVDDTCVRIRGIAGEPGVAYGSLLRGLEAATGHPHPAPVVPRLLALLNKASSADPASGRPTPQQVAELMLAAARQDPTRPVRLLVDDVHLCDEPSQDVLVQLAHQGYSAGVRTVLSADDTADLVRFDAVARVRLGPLGLEPTTDLAWLTSGVLPPHRVAQLLHLWSGGNPMLLIDLVHELSAAELRGTAPITLPLTPSPALVEDAGGALRDLTDRSRQLLAVFAVVESLPADLLERLAGADRSSPSALETLLTQHWLRARRSSVAPSRRLDALVAWAQLSPSAQQLLAGQLADLLEESSPHLALYLGALAGERSGSDELPARLAALVGSGIPQLRSGIPQPVAAASALLLRRPSPLPVGLAVVLVQLLVADGYSEAARTALSRLASRGDAPRVPLLALITQLAAMSSDPADAFGYVDAFHPPDVELDQWVSAVLTLCRVQLALDGPSESTRLLSAIRPVLSRTTRETRALATLVAVERDVYRELPDAPAALRSAVDAWLAEHSGPLDLGLMSAILDLLGLGRVRDARGLLALLGSPTQLPHATSRSAVLVLRTEAEIAAGHYRRAAALLLENDAERPSPSGADLMIVSQAIRIGTVCDDITRCRLIEERLSRQAGAVLTYPSKRSHTAARGYRELALGNYAQSRVLLALALEGPALLLQGRTCILTDLVEATAADGDRGAAADLLDRHLGWLPDAGGERAPGLLARCQALVAPPDLVDARFAAALAAHPSTHEADRARTLIAYGRTLVDLGRRHDARRPLTAAVELLRESGMPGWERHAQALLDRTSGSRPSPASTNRALTEFEQRVLDLVLERRRNRDIAAALFVSLRTVESHLTRIFRKLGVSTKAQLFRQLHDPGQPKPGPAELDAPVDRPSGHGPAQLTRNSAPPSQNGFQAASHQR